MEILSKSPVFNVLTNGQYSKFCSALGIPIPTASRQTTEGRELIKVSLLAWKEQQGPQFTWENLIGVFSEMKLAEFVERLKTHFSKPKENTPNTEDSNSPLLTAELSRPNRNIDHEIVTVGTEEVPVSSSERCILKLHARLKYIGLACVCILILAAAFFVYRGQKSSSSVLVVFEKSNFLQFNNSEHLRAFSMDCQSLISGFHVKLLSQNEHVFGSEPVIRCSESVKHLTIVGKMSSRALDTILAQTIHIENLVLELATDTIGDYPLLLGERGKELSRLTNITIFCIDCENVHSVISSFDLPALVYLRIESSTHLFKSFHVTGYGRYNPYARFETLKYIEIDHIAALEKQEIYYDYCFAFPHAKSLNSLNWNADLSQVSICNNIESLYLKVQRAHHNMPNNVSDIWMNFPNARFVTLELDFVSETNCPSEGLTGWNELRTCIYINVSNTICTIDGEFNNFFRSRLC